MGLLALLAAVHYAYYVGAPADRAQLWNIGGAVGRAALLVPLAIILVAQLSGRSRNVFIGAVVWWLLEEMMVAGCSAAYIVHPWVVPEGQDQCSSLLRFDLGKLGACVLAILVFLLPVRPDTTQEPQERER